MAPPLPFRVSSSASKLPSVQAHYFADLPEHDERRRLRRDPPPFPDSDPVLVPQRSNPVQGIHGQSSLTASPPTRTRLHFDDNVTYGYRYHGVDQVQRIGSSVHDVGELQDGGAAIATLYHRTIPVAASDPILQAGGAVRNTDHVPRASPIRRSPRKRGAATPARAQPERTPKKSRSTSSRRDKRTPPRASTNAGGEAVIPLSDTLSSEEIAELRKILYPMYKQRKPEHWKFIYLVCKAKHLDVEKRDRRSQHARCAYCTKCNVEITFKQSVTAHVTRHMQRCHPETLKQAQLERRKNNRLQPLIHREAETTGSEPNDPCTEAEQTRAEDLAAIWTCKSNRPFTTVEDKYFRKYSRHLNSVRGRVKIPKSWKVRERVATIAVDLRSVLKEEIRLECDYYSASSDIWTARNKLAFICFTLHYVDKEFNMRSWVLEVKVLPGKHDAGAIKNALQEFMTAWGLKKEKCVKLLRDGATNGSKACDLLGLSSMSCLAHCLHLIVGSGIVKKKPTISAKELLKAAKTSQDVDDAIEAEACEEIDAFIGSECESARADLDKLRTVVDQFRKLAVFFSWSTKAIGQLISLQKTPLLPTTDCATRWNSTHAMLVRMLELRTTLEDFFEYVGTSGEFADSTAAQPTAEQWFTIRCLVVLLEPFAKATTGLGGEKYPTLVMAVPVLWQVRRKLANEAIFASVFRSVGSESYVPRVEALMHSVRRAYLKLFEDRFINPIKVTKRSSKAKKPAKPVQNKDKITEELMWISMLDPRSSELKHLTPADAERARENLIDAAVELAKEMNEANGCNDENASSGSNLAQLTTPHKENLAWLTDVYSGGVDNCNEEPIPEHEEKIRERCKSQLLVYMSNAHKTPVTINALEWWRDNQKGCSIIAALARKWLGCIATSVPSERAFSKGGNVVTSKRCSLGSDTIRDVMFIGENYADEDDNLPSDVNDIDSGSES